MPAFFRSALGSLSSACTDCEHTIQRLASIPSKLSADGNKRSSTVKPANKPFSFNNYAFKPAPQPSSPHVPVDPAELTRRLERYLASLEPASDAATLPSKPTASSGQASSAVAARNPAGPSQQQNNSGSNPQLSKLRTESATASAHSLASPSSGAAASPSKKPSRTALNGGAALLASRTVTDLPRSDEDRATLEALRQEARRAARRSVALHASKGLNAPVAAGELAKRLSALNGSGVDPAVSAAVLARRPSPARTNSGGDVRRSSSARANEKRTRTPGLDLRKSSSMRIAEARIAALEREREKTRAKETHGNRKSVRRSMPVGVDTDQLWRIYVSTQHGANSQAMAMERQQSLRKSASARKTRPLSKIDIDLAGTNGGKVLQKSRSTGCVEQGDGTLMSGDPGKTGDCVLARRPDWSQRDELEKLPLHSPLHLHFPGFGRRSSLATETQSEDERGVSSDAESKRRSKTPEVKSRYRRSVCVVGAANQTTSSSATSRRSPPELPGVLRIPSPRSSGDIVTLEQISSSSPPLSSATTSPPSITLSPVDSPDAIPMHIGFGTTTATTNNNNRVYRSSSMRNSSPPMLPALRHSSSFEARIPQHLVHSSPADSQRHHQSSSHALFTKSSGGKPAPMAPLPEVTALPAPDRSSKKRPTMPPRQKTSSTYNLAAATATAAAENKARGQREQGSVTSPASAAPSSVPWPGPSAPGRGGRTVMGAASGVAQGQTQHQHPRAAMRGARSQSAMEIRVKAGSNSNSNGSNNNKALNRRKSVTFASATVSYSAPTSYVGVSSGVGILKEEQRSGAARRGIQRSSTLPPPLPIKSRDGDEGKAKEKEIEPGNNNAAANAKTPARLSFWRRDSGKVVDEVNAMSSGGEEHSSGVKSPSRLAFWKKGK
ncbi:isoform b [Diplodia corticola]|uniref:Isoform b n=1 Tax=Diplodia corticola TaxID=236234 RepID=A0A1J9S0W9_9PEZI|nr:isoform b [Diplodia corticola]OJD33301.1 isoform b [Diplodia corticola]